MVLKALEPGNKRHPTHTHFNININLVSIENQTRNIISKMWF